MSDALLQEILRRLAYLEKATGFFVDDASLDDPKSNPVVKFPSKHWRGPDFTGKRFSECSPAFLVAHAEWLAWKGAHPKAGKEKYAAFDLLDAARARTWARRLARGKRETLPSPAPFGDEDEDLFGDEDELPFR